MMSAAEKADLHLCQVQERIESLKQRGRTDIGMTI